MDKKKKNPDKKVHQDIEGFDIKISQFGELESNLSVDKINEFLNQNLKDKKIDSEEE